MELALLLLAVAAVGIAGDTVGSVGGSEADNSTTTNSNSSGSRGDSSSGSGTVSASVLPELRCGPTDRGGRRLFGTPRPVRPPPGCQRLGPGRGAVLCDLPGDDYPWEAIDSYLRHSSDMHKKRIENTLKASRIAAPNSIHRRRKSRSADDVIKIDDLIKDAEAMRDDVFAADTAEEKIRAKKHVDAPTERQRVSVAKATAATRTTTHGPQLDDLTELVYASATTRQPTEAEVPPPTARTTPRPTSTWPTPDPYTESACEFWEEMRSPFYAMNTHNEWKVLINLPNYETYIHMEHCKEEKSQGRCAEGCRCTQKYTIRNMPVYDRDANGCDVIYMDKFLFPSHCDCKCLPPGYTLFRKPPLPTTPLPEVVEFVGPLPEGWLPARPMKGRPGVKGEGGEEKREGEVEVEEAEVVRDGDEEVVGVEVEMGKGQGEERKEVVEVEEVELARDGHEELKVLKVVEAVDEQDKAAGEKRPGATTNSRPTAPSTRQTTAPPRRTTRRPKPSRAPPPAAILEHVTVRPRRPTAGPPPSPLLGSAPNARWQALARQRPARRPAAGPRPNLRNHLRGPPADVGRR